MAEIDALTMDQIRLFVGVADDGSFSATARRLHRAQSAVSYGIGNLERNLDVQLFDRSARRPVLTPIGKSLLSDARQVLSAIHRFGARASGVAEGLELEVSVAVSAICPADLLIAFGRAFRERFPCVALRIQTEVMEAVVALVLDGSCQLGISGPFAEDDTRLDRRFLTHISLVPVAAVDHALTQENSAKSRTDVRDELQIVIAQRFQSESEVTSSVLSTKTWRVADASTKLGLIRAGLGWGYLPWDLVQADLAQGRLVQLVLEERGPGPMRVPLTGITRTESPPGPAGRWLLNEMAAICKECPKTKQT
jgi:DNA-binding transcriptional LysR family regulator